MFSPRCRWLSFFVRRLQDCAPPSDGYGSNMSAIEQIHQMPLHEKILVMEAIWDDICREEEKLDVPQWHKDILDERER